MLLLSVHRESIGVLGQRAEVVDAVGQDALIDRGRDVVVDLGVRRREATRIDRVESDVRPVRQVEQVAVGLPVVDVGEIHAIGVTPLAGVAALRLHRIAREAAVGADADLGPLGGARGVREPRVVPGQHPPVGDRDDRLPFLAHAAQVHAQVPSTASSTRFSRRRLIISCVTAVRMPKQDSYSFSSGSRLAI